MYFTRPIGDGYCDDVANNEQCEFDGGDCCRGEDGDSPVNCNFCSECLCLADLERQCSDLEIATTTTTEGSNNDCPYGQEMDSESFWLVMAVPGNGICEDNSNIEQCAYDGGDCCNPEAECNCNDCICYEKGYQVCTESSCFDINWKGMHELKST